MFSAKCRGLRKKTYLHVFCKIQIAENNMFFSFRNFAEKNSIYILYILVFPPCGVTGVGMDGLKAQPARSLPLPR